jgi:hypothetical protein
MAGKALQRYAFVFNCSKVSMLTEVRWSQAGQCRLSLRTKSQVTHITIGPEASRNQQKSKIVDQRAVAALIDDFRASSNKQRAVAALIDDFRFLCWTS